MKVPENPMTPFLTGTNRRFKTEDGYSISDPLRAFLEVRKLFIEISDEIVDNGVCLVRITDRFSILGNNRIIWMVTKREFEKSFDQFISPSGEVYGPIEGLTEPKHLLEQVVMIHPFMDFSCPDPEKHDLSSCLVRVADLSILTSNDCEKFGLTGRCKTVDT